MSDFRLTTETDAVNPVVHDLMLDATGSNLLWVGLDAYDTEDQARMIAQRIKCRLLMIRGEWYLDQRLGTPWRKVLTAKGTPPARMVRIFREVLGGTPGVAEVLECSVAIDKTTRIATMTFQVRAETGVVIGPETLDLPFIVRDAGGRSNG